jgi:hypothetical protein
MRKMNRTRKSLYDTSILALVLAVVVQLPALDAVCAMCNEVDVKVMPCHAESASSSVERASLQAACCCEIGAVPEQTDATAPNQLAEPPTAQGNHLWHTVVSLGTTFRATRSAEIRRPESFVRPASTPLFVLNSSFLI